MTRGSGKPAYVVNCAKLLAEAKANVLILDGLMYEQGTILHQFYQILGTAPVLEDGKNLYDLIRDYEVLCQGGSFPANECSESVRRQLTYPVTKRWHGGLLPDVCGRASLLPGQEAISYLPGNNGDVVEVRERIDFNDLFEHKSGYHLFCFIAQELVGRYDLILLNAPAGHQEISGIMCGQMADLLLAIDLDSPMADSTPSYEACMRLIKRVNAGGGRVVDVKSVRGLAPEAVVEMIL